MKQIGNHNNNSFKRKKLEATSKGSQLNWGKRWGYSKQREQYAQKGQKSKWLL